MKKTIFSLLLIFFSWSFFSCDRSAELDDQGIPKTLLIGTPGGNMAGLYGSALEPLRKYLEKNLKRPVKFILATDYTSVIEALKAKKIHMAYLPPFAYVLASQKMKMVPIITLGEGGKPAMYHSCIITNPQSGINSIEDLKKNSKRLSICFPDPASTSGHLIPGAYLKSIGLNPETAFKASIFSGDHVATIMSVASGKVDIGCTMTEMGVYRLEAMGQIKKENVKILWISPPIVSDAIVMRSDINRDFDTQVQKLYLNVKKEDPNAFNIFQKFLNRDPAKLDFMVVQDSMYDGLRKIARDMNYLDAKK